MPSAIKKVIVILAICASAHSLSAQEAEGNRVTAILRADTMMPLAALVANSSVPVASLEYVIRLSNKRGLLLAAGYAHHPAEADHNGFYSGDLFGFGIGMDHTPGNRDVPTGYLFSWQLGFLLNQDVAIPIPYGRADFGYQHVDESGLTVGIAGSLVISMSMLPLFPMLKLSFGYAFR